MPTPELINEILYVKNLHNNCIRNLFSSIDLICFSASSSRSFSTTCFSTNCPNACLKLWPHLLSFWCRALFGNFGCNNLANQKPNLRDVSLVIFIKQSSTPCASKSKNQAKKAEQGNQASATYCAYPFGIPPVLVPSTVGSASEVQVRRDR